MQGDKDLTYKIAIRELIAIGAIKLVFVVFVFAFSTVVTEAIKLYLFKADNWLTDNSRAVSREVRDLYR